MSVLFIEIACREYLLNNFQYIEQLGKLEVDGEISYV